jgi:hypothetical protein
MPMPERLLELLVSETAKKEIQTVPLLALVLLWDHRQYK